VGGGTALLYQAAGTMQGPSPRGRGNQALSVSPEDAQGAIPAWAGEPPIICSGTGVRRGHPRVGGGTHTMMWMFCRYRGPSPRGRGNPRQTVPQPRFRGAIPAWAGEPGERRQTRLHDRGHPRVGGGTRRRIVSDISGRGPSPRGRGNPKGGRHAGPDPGAIPAWAGEPAIGTTAVVTMSGPSPRGRGNLTWWEMCPAPLGAIPAWAGEPATRRVRRRTTRGHPRVGGGTQRSKPLTTFASGPSPRGRGNLWPIRY
jgi:hypothetical protein